jgi:branched-chain amino acid transport system substrate-binding protein
MPGSRISVVVVALLAAVGSSAAFSTACSSAPPPTKAVKVGIVLTYSGPDASIGEAIDRGAELYRTLHKADLPEGVELQLIKRDETGPTPDVAKRLARELIVREGVQILTGGQWTPNVSAIAPLATEAGIPYVVMSSGTASTTRLSPFLVRVAFTTWQHSYHLGKWAAANGLTRVSTVVSDYAAGLDAEDAFVQGFKGAGGQIVSSVRAPLRTADYVPFLERVRRDKPQAVYGFNPGGPEATRFIKAYHDLGLAAAGIQLIGPNAIVPDDELKNMGEAALNVISASHYSAAGDRPANRNFVNEWKKAYGQDTVPNYFAVGGWDGMAAIFAVIREQNGVLDPKRSREILTNWSNPDSPRGPMRIDPETRDVIQNIYIRRVQQVDGELRNVEFATIPDVKDPWKELHPESAGSR